MAHKSEPQVDAALIRQLAELLTETGLSEIEYGLGEMRIRVARHLAPAPAIALPPAVVSSAAVPAAAADDLGAGERVKSPMVGTVYLAAEPGAAAFVRAGEQVNQGQTLLIIEAMKVMNQIKAPKAGRVSRILVADGAPVEFGEILLVID